MVCLPPLGSTAQIAAASGIRRLWNGRAPLHLVPQFLLVQRKLILFEEGLRERMKFSLECGAGEALRLLDGVVGSF